MIYMNFNSYASLVMFFMIPAWLYSVFEHETTYAIRVLSMFDFYYRKKAHNLTESENLLNSDCPFRFLFEDFLLCSRFFLIIQLRRLACFQNFVRFFSCFLPARFFQDFIFN